MNELSNLNDAEFVQRLKQFLMERDGITAGDPQPMVPLFWADGKIEREKTLALPCYQNFQK